MFVYHFLDPGLGVKIFFEEEGDQNKVALILK